MIHRRCFLSAFAILALILTACAPRLVTVTVTSPPETVVVTATPSPSPTSPPPSPKSLSICIAGEPDTLYLYGGSQLPATRHVMEALYDGPIDHLDYAYQPVILQKLPSLSDGDAVTTTVYVRRGDRLVDATGELLELSDGVRVRPSGCYTTSCEVTFDGGLVRMDRMEVTFSLREDVTWSDGEPLTAEDSEFGFEVASDPATPGYRYLTDRTATYRAIDERRTKWVGVPGFIDHTYFLNFFLPLPRHQLEGRPVNQLPGYDEVRRAPLGWGPFVAREWVRGDHMTLSRNPRYFRADEGLPRLDEITFKFTSDASEMIAGLLSGECDIATHDADFEPFMPLLVQAEERGLLSVISAPGTGWEHLDFAIDTISDDDRPNVFAQTRVRRAVARCVDRQAIVDEIVFGRSVVPHSYLSPADPLYPEGALTEWAHNPEAGRTLLDEVGWRDEDGDGVREAVDVEGVRDGESFRVVLLTSSDSEMSLETARIIRAQLADCGMRVIVESLPRWELLADGPEGLFSGRRFDLMEMTWWLDDRPPCSHYLSSESLEGMGRQGRNPGAYSNPGYDAACLSALRALPGTPAYERYHKQAQIIFSEDLPALPLFMRLRVALARPRVTGFQMDATAASELWGLESLDVTTEGVAGQP